MCGVLWSKESVKSHWVKTEAYEGNRRRILVPVMIEDVVLPLAFRLIQAAKLIDWDGTLPNQQFDLLIGSVKRTLGQTAPERIKNRDDEIAKKDTKEEKQKQSQEEKTFTNSIGMKFALIPAGDFMMGSNEYDTGRPVHKVTISKPFYLGVYPVTQQEWSAVMKKNPSRFKGEHLPVEQVSWNDVQEFIKKLNEKESTNKYRMPSEAEWEYAARAGTTTRYSFGDGESKLGEYAWYDENSDGNTHSVGEKKPNPWGLNDVHGNVWEWVRDSWHGDYNGAPTDGSSWEKGVGSARVLRGGSWDLNAGNCWSAIHSYADPGARADDLGFRLLRIL